MLDAIVELTRVRPPVHTMARFDTRELRCYTEGYYAGVVQALRVADLAVARFALRTKTVRAAGRAKRSA